MTEEQMIDKVIELTKSGAMDWVKYYEGLYRLGEKLYSRVFKSRDFTLTCRDEIPIKLEATLDMQDYWEVDKPMVTLDPSMEQLNRLALAIQDQQDKKDAIAEQERIAMNEERKAKALESFERLYT